VTGTTRGVVLALLAAAAVALPIAGCGRDDPDLSEGKALFVQGCGSCHTLNRAGTAGQTGPNLDAAFQTALRDGMDRDTVEGVVHRQILHPLKNGEMPPEIFTGEQARNVAAYVAYATSRTGQDGGALAQAGLAGAKTGEQIFTAAGCAGCHTLAKANATGTTGPNLDELAQSAAQAEGSPEEYVRQSLLDPDAVVAEGFQPGVMPAYEGRLTDEQLQTLVEYLLEGR
jgi:mono/diheme cytochrome c family protein